MDKKILKEFIGSGFVFKEQLFPTEKGSPQGGVISPILANMVLNGMERLVKTKFKGCNLTRYADDFVVTCHNPEEAEEIKQTLAPFLLERGLELSEEKTLTTHINKGFDFLGWNFRKYRSNGKTKMLIKPSQKSLKAIMDSVKETVLRHGIAKTQDDVIRELNPKLRGWGNYHAGAVSYRTFRYLDLYVFKTLLRWATRRHSKKGRKWITNRYWHSKGSRKWTFSTDRNILFLVRDIPIRRHSKIIGSKNPYIDTEYFLNKRKNRKFVRGFRDEEFAMD